MKNLIALILALILVFPLTACTSGTVEPGNATPSPAATPTAEPPDTGYVPVAVEYDGDDLDTAWDDTASQIVLNGDSIDFDGSGAIVDGSRITIIAGGTYVFSGSLQDGQILVNTEDVAPVRLVFNGADITCATGAPVYVVSAEKAIITLADGTENRLADGETYIFDDAEADEPNAAVFSKSDLTINGGGSLTVKANYNNGIQSKDALKITGGTITVDAANDGIKGKDELAIKDGVITVTAGGDGLQASNGKDASKGFVAIEGGSIDITAELDGIQAETNVLVSGGEITLATGGGSVNSSSGDNWGDWGGGRGDRGMMQAQDTADDSPSAKGIKAGVDVTITGGTITIDSSDDSIHSNSSLTIDGGSIVMASGDDGIHADTTLEINGGDISITKSYEGIESSGITINDGTIHVVASDDGFNAAGGADGSSVNGRPGQNNFSPMGEQGGSQLHLNGGYVFVNAGGDGLDCNGAMDMTGGTVIVNGPTNSGNGPLDYLGSFNVTGGFLIAAGSSGMAQAPSSSSTQYSIMVNLTESLAAGTLFHIETGAGEEILTMEPLKTYQSVVLCSPDLQNGATYNVYTGGSATGTLTNSLYAGGEYTPGTRLTGLTIEGMVTTYGSGGGMGGGMRQPGGRR